MAGVSKLHAAQVDEQALDRLMEAQRAYHLSGATRSYEFRAAMLKRLYEALKQNEERLNLALAADLGKPAMEAYIGDVGFALSEISHALKHLRRWMAPQRVATPLTIQPASSYIYSEPRGRVLIIGAWNYPVNLTLSPLVGAIAGGNCAVIKPPELTPQTSGLLAELIATIFPSEFVAVIEGGPETATALLRRQWDYIFFTGSTRVGKIVAQAAAVYMTPYTLELGGKSPAIVEPDADLDLAAQRIFWSKYFNAGQTCIATDYLLVHRSVKAKLVEKLKALVAHSFGNDPARSPDFGRIVSEGHWDRLMGLMGAGQIIGGGTGDRASRYVAPTIIDGVKLSDPIMQDEIFGPILPVITYDHLDEAIAVIRQIPNPLTLYLFTHDKHVQDRIIAEVPFGGGCINQTGIHFGNPELPFGGRGASGTGAYHGKHSFDTFTHKKAVLKAGNLWEPPLKYHPYSPKKLKAIRQFLK